MYARSEVRFAALVSYSFAGALACTGTRGAGPSVDRSLAPKPAPLRPQAELSSPLLENKFGVLGAPRDDTSFEYDVADQEGDPSPVLDGVPPFTRAVGAALAPYLETRRARLAAVAPDAKSILVLTRLSETTQAHLVSAPLGMRRQLTFGPDAVEQAAFLPGSTRACAYRSDVSGNEDHQLFVLDLQSRRTRRWTDGKSRHGPFRWSNSGRVAYTSNARNGRDMDLYVQDTEASAPRRVAELNGEWVALGWAGDGERLLMHEFRSTDESTVHVVDVGSGAVTPLAPLTPGDATRSAWFAQRPGRAFVISNRGREFAAVFEVEIETQAWKRVTPELDWNVEEATSSGDGRRLVYAVNENGYSRLWLLDLATGKRRTLTVPEGVISGMRFIERDRKLAFTLTTPTHPEDVLMLHLDSGRLESWTDSEVGGLYLGNFVKPELVRAPSFDGLVISGLLYRPRGVGPFPVLLWMHGGPEDQARPAFDPIIQYFAATRKVAVLAPNVRGSDGYGKRFLKLDDREQRHAAVADVGAMLDFIARDPALDERRVGIHGASYGGFMVLAALAEYPDRFVAGSNVVGMSDLVTFLENTRDYRRDLRRVEYGDERDPQMRAYLTSISPIHRVERIRSALLVAHGENDPRVPLAQAQEVVRAVRSTGAEAWFVSAREEG
ncbi:MAG TPA: prolyl oligopeptidase family serine peptidase, partial [Polyangiaceae bacterium]